MRPTSLIFMMFCCFTTGVVQAQVLPLDRTGSLIVADSMDDKMYRLTDINLDGDYEDAGEVLLYYSGGMSGHFLDVPNTVTVDHKGNIHVVDSSTDVILAMRDMNGDGDAEDYNEEWIYFDVNNGSYIEIWSLMGMAFNSDGTSYVCQSGSGAGVLEDYVFYAHDDNKDGDVNDAGEVDIYYDPLSLDPGLPVLETPSGCAVDHDGTVYVSDPKLDTIYRMEDLNGDGDVNDDVGGEFETRPYYTGINGPSVPTTTNSINFTRDGGLLMADTINDNILIGYDGNGDGDIDDVDEVIEYLTIANGLWPHSSWSVEVAGTNDLYWDVYAADIGKLNVIGDCIIGMRDKNSDGDADDTDEVAAVYNQDTASHYITKTRCCGFMKGPYLSRNGEAHIGQPAGFVLSGTVDNTYVLVFSLISFAGYTYPPYGVIEIAPPYLFLDTGTIGADGTSTYTLNVPYAGGIVGYHFYLQAVEGDSYLYLVSNMVDTEIMP